MTRTSARTNDSVIMTEPSKTTETGLTSLRKEIDSIDHELLHLLGKRRALSREVVKQKVLGSNVFRPDREASMMRALIAANPSVDARLIFALWRQIISASIAEQKPDYLISHSANARDLTRQHGAGFMKEDLNESPKQAVGQLADGLSDCAIITTDELAEIQSDLGDDKGLYIAASIPFLRHESDQTGFVICRNLPDDTDDDEVLVKQADGHLGAQKASEALPSDIIVGKYAKPIMQS